MITYHYKLFQFFFAFLQIDGEVLCVGREFERGGFHSNKRNGNQVARCGFNAEFTVGIGDYHFAIGSYGGT